MQFPGGQLVGQPLPAAQRTDDRYALLGKLQGVLRTLHLKASWSWWTASTSPI